MGLIWAQGQSGGVPASRGMVMKCDYLLLGAHLLDVMKYIDYVANASRGLLNFGRQADTAHRHRLHTVAHKGFRVEKTLKQDLTSCHCHL